MADQKSTKKFYISPKGVVQPYAWLAKADTKFKAAGEYKVAIAVSEKDGRKMFEAIEAAHDANFAKAQKDPKLNAKGKKVIEAGLPVYFDDELNKYVFTFKMNASYIDKKDNETKQIVLRCVDAKGERMPKVPAISQGSEIKVRFSMLPFAAAGGIGAGIKLQMDSIMLVKLVEFTGSGGEGQDSNWADEHEEGGYEREARDDFESEEDEDQEADNDDGGDF